MYGAEVKKGFPRQRDRTVYPLPPARPHILPSRVLFLFNHLDCFALAALNETTTTQEMLGNSAKARAIFERWMEWEPEDNAWSAYVKFEMRQEEPANARWGEPQL